MAAFQRSLFFPAQNFKHPDFAKMELIFRWMSSTIFSELAPISRPTRYFWLYSFILLSLKRGRFGTAFKSAPV